MTPDERQKLAETIRDALGDRGWQGWVSKYGRAIAALDALAQPCQECERLWEERDEMAPFVEAAEAYCWDRKPETFNALMNARGEYQSRVGRRKLHALAAEETGKEDTDES